MSKTTQQFACSARHKCGVADCPEATPHQKNDYCDYCFCGANGEDCFCEPVTEDEK